VLAGNLGLGRLKILRKLFSTWLPSLRHPMLPIAKHQTLDPTLCARSRYQLHLLPVFRARPASRARRQRRLGWELEAVLWVCWNSRSCKQIRCWRHLAMLKRPETTTPVVSLVMLLKSVQKADLVRGNSFGFSSHPQVLLQVPILIGISSRRAE
jgi:hypothetical protein